tara:strand:+ start:2593 stop:2991 length:399 start_codon:yes stop_codon:yes gene_type:complete
MTFDNVIKIYFFFILIFSLEANSKTYEKKKFICADEIGPVIEFQVPNFDNGQVKKELSFKLFSSADRKSFYDESGTMLKQSSPIDNSYFYYKVDTVIKNEESINLIFEFFPPSTLMLKRGKYMFETLACWND